MGNSSEDRRGTLLFLTRDYPGDNYAERAFAYPELAALARKFDRIIIMPLDYQGTRLGYPDSLPPGVEVDWSLAHDPVTHNRALKAFYIFHPFALQSLASMVGEARTLRQWGKGVLQAVNTLSIGRVVLRTLRRHGLGPHDTLLYAFWFLDIGAALARIAREDGWKCAVRGHTSDIFTEKTLFRSDKVRNRLLRGVSKVLTISNTGREYLAQRFPDHKEKFVTMPLGSVKLYESGLYTPSDGLSRPLEILTVARIEPVKRIDMIFRILERLAMLNPERSMLWTVIGSGTLADKISQQVKTNRAGNLKINFTGMLTNEQIQKRYASNPPQWFMLASRSEGVPVSMGEAMSYGVPVITTNVGQIYELADEICSVNLGDTPDIEEAAEQLSRVIFDTGLQQNMSAAAKRRWERLFNGEPHSEATARLLRSLL